MNDEDKIKKLLKNKIILKKDMFIYKNFIYFKYNAKDKKSPYDSTPLIMVLGRNNTHTIGLNFNWCPIPLRKKLLRFIKNQKNNKIRLNDYRFLVRTFGVIIRKYINSRISKNGVLIDIKDYKDISKLRTDKFIGIKPETAWNLAKRNKI